MRLTLRTLVAWLDDTLSPGEVRTIGQQVSESPFAQELVERVNRVTRQRRLAAPGSSGSDATDPNIVAAYLDNELQPDQVAEFEKKCLTSDVHLAEVASVHQILSLIGHKAKVPVDAKNRMYRLVRGRETTAAPAEPPGPRGKAAPIPPPAPEPESERPAPSAWQDASSSTGSNPIERFAPWAVVAGLVGVLGWTALHSLQNETAPQVTPPPRPQPVAPPPQVAVIPSPTPEVAKPAPTPVEPAPVAEVREPGSLGTFDEIQGVVLRFNADSSAWERISAKTSIRPKTRLLNLAPFRNTLKFAKGEIDLVDSTELVVDEPGPDEVAQIDLRRGELALRGGDALANFAVGTEGQTMSIRTPAGVDVGVDRLPILQPGREEPSPTRLRVFVPSGEVVVRSGEVEEKITGPGGVALLGQGRFDDRSHQAPPAWVTKTEETPFTREISDQFVAYFRPDRPILADLVEAMDDSQKDVKRMAVQALGGIGDIESVIAVLEGKVDAATHRSAVDVLWTNLALGGEAAKAVHDGLERQYGPDWGAITQRLLVRFVPEAARDETTMTRLVEYLAAAPGRGTRELALDNLCELTHRDSLEYDPDQPEGKGLRAWQDFVKKEFAPNNRGGNSGGGGAGARSVAPPRS